MPKKTTLLIVVLAIVTAVLLFLAISQSGKQSNSLQTNVTPTEKPVQKTAKVFFNPSSIDLSSGSSATPTSIDIMVDSGNQDIAGVQAELQFDPQAISNVKIIPSTDNTSFFGTGSNVLFNDVNVTTGRISYAIAIGPNQPGKKGVGKVATLTFQRGFGSAPATTINFLDKTLVTTLGESQSVLKNTTPLNITLTSTTNIAPQVSSAPVTSTAPIVTTAPPVQ